MGLEVVGAKARTTTTSELIMPAELPSVEEEKQLRELVDTKVSLEVIMVKLHKSMDSVQKKCARLGLEVDGGAKKIKAPSSSSVGLKLPKELPSVEEEKQLRELVLAHRSLGVIVGSLGKTKESIRCKIARMHLVDDNHLKSQRSLSTCKGS